MKRRATAHNEIIPISYDIEIEPDLRTFTFEGNVDMAVEVRKKTNRITLNSKELKIKKATSTFAEGANCKVVENSSYEEIEILFKNKINGKGIIHIEYEGVHNDNVYGFSRYGHKENSRKEYVVSTRLEPTGARAVFPCIDSPAYKAIFNVTLKVDRKLEALSNMPVKSQRNIGNKIVVTFEQTPPMPTYLLFMAAGKFKFSENKIEGHKIRVITAPGRMHKTKTALRYAKETIRFYENYLGVKYPFPKLDLVAIPGYGRNTMEHLGVVSFGEMDMFADSASSPELKLEIRRTIAHEFAHQWFGNLVTVKDWGDIWLSEGVATFLSSKVLGENPYDSIRESLEADSSAYTHPLSIVSGSYSNPRFLFDYITYVKGAALLVMLESLMGSKSFKEGLHRYLKAFTRKSASTRDFSDAMGSAMPTAKDSRAVKKFIIQWATESGYPIIKVSRESNSLLLKQYLFTPVQNRKMKEPRIMPVDIYNWKREWRTIIDRDTMRVSSSGAWAKLNSGQRTLCRVEYAPDTLKELGRQIQLGNIPDVDAKGLLDDLFVFMRSGRINLDEVLMFINDYCQNTGLDIDGLILKQLVWVYGMTDEIPTLHDKVKKIIASKSILMLSKTKLRSKKREDITVTQARNIAFDALGFIGDQKTALAAKRMLKNEISRKAIDGSIRPYVYKIAARNSDRDMYDTFLRMRKKASMDEDEYILAAIASFSNKSIIPEALDYLISNDVPNSTHLIKLAASTPKNCSDIVWPWMKHRWGKISKKYNSVSLSEMLESLWMISDRYTKADIKRFFRKCDMRSLGVDEVLKRVLETIDTNMRFMRKNDAP